MLDLRDAAQGAVGLELVGLLFSELALQVCEAVLCSPASRMAGRFAALPSGKTPHSRLRFAPRDERSASLRGLPCPTNGRTTPLVAALRLRRAHFTVISGTLTRYLRTLTKSSTWNRMRLGKHLRLEHTPVRVRPWLAKRAGRHK